MAIKITVQTTENTDTNGQITSLTVTLQGSYETETGPVTSEVTQTYTFTEPKAEVAIDEKRKIIANILKDNVNNIIADIKAQTGLDNLGETIIIM